MKKLLIILPLILLFFTIVFVIDNSNSEVLLEDNVSVNGLEDNVPIGGLEDDISVSELERSLSLSEDKNIFVYFYQTDCIYCKNTTPIIATLTDELGIDLKVVNLQEEPIGWEKFTVDGTPTLIHYKNGKEISRILGQETEEKFKEFFKNI